MPIGSYREAERAIEAGADVLYVHPWLKGENWQDFVNLYKTFDEAVEIPIIGLTVGVPTAVIKEISIACPNVAAWRFDCSENMGLIKHLVRAIQEVGATTGRHVAALRAGDHSPAECLVNGAEGNFNGGGSWRGREDVAIHKAVKKGDLNEAFAIQKRIEPATETMRGFYGTIPLWRFPHRYKVATWLLGTIPNQYARLPRTAFSDEEVLRLRDALMKSGFKVVREPAECKKLGIDESGVLWRVIGALMLGHQTGRRSFVQSICKFESLRTRRVDHVSFAPLSIVAMSICHSAGSSCSRTHYNKRQMPRLACE